MPLTPRDIAAVLLGIGGARSGNPTGIQTFAQLDLQQQARTRQAEQDRMAREVQQAQLANLTSDNARADAQVADAQNARRMQFLQSLPAFLGDESIDSPDLFNARLGMAQQMGGMVGVEPGFIAKSFTVAPDKFAQRKAKKVVSRIENDRRFQAVLAHPDFQGQMFEDGGERRTYAEWKALAGQGGPMAGSPPMPMKTADTPNTPEEQFYVTYASERNSTWDKLPTAEKTKARKMWMQADDRPRVDPNASTSAGALPPRTQRLVDSQAKGFDAQPIVKNTQKLAEAASFVNSLDLNTKNPADDQALIYAFAKAMDPESVVREGEYNTVAKYAQSWLTRFKFDAMRVLTASEFLTPEARANLKATILQRYVEGRKQYDNVRRSYANRINRITGMQDGDTHLIDYGAAFPEGPVAQPERGPTPLPRKNPFRR